MGVRELIFKAKRLDNGEWVEGFLFLYDGWCIGRIDEPLAPNVHSELIGEGVDWFRIDANTICQYTGLTDKNGNKIWENDVCSTDLKRRYKIVRFRNGCFMYNVNDGGEDYYDIMMPIEPLVDSDEFTEVIGNIFDNPELLENE